MEFLKALFGTTADGKPEALTYDQLAEKVTAGKLKVVNLADGGYVSKDKHTSEIATRDAKISGLETQLSEANTTIQSYKDMDIDGIKKSATEWEQKYATDTKALQDQLDGMARSHAADMFMAGYKFSSKAAAAGIRAEFDAKKFELKDGAFIGAKEWMEGLTKDADYQSAFAPATPPADPKKPKFSDPEPKKDPPPARKSLSQMMAAKNADPNYTPIFE